MNTLKAFAKRVIDGALRRLGLVRTAVAAAQTADAIYLSELGRLPSPHERAESAAALRNRDLSVPALANSLRDSAEGRLRLWEAALPLFVEADYVGPQAHCERLVETAFLAVLGRAPESDALSTYESALRSGRLSVDALVADLWKAQEASDRILSQGYLDQARHLAQVVDALFLALLGRPPEAEARAAYAEALKSGSLTIEDVVKELLGTPEAENRILSMGYVSRRGQLWGQVEAIIKTALGRYDEGVVAAFVNVLETDASTLDGVIEEVSSSAEARQRALALVEPSLKDHGYWYEAHHYAEIVDAIFRSILGRPADDAGRDAFVGYLTSGKVTVEGAIDQIMNSDEVRLRVHQVGLPDVLEGIYRTVMGTPETDPALRGLIRSATSARTFETIKNMTLSAEACHYILQPIIRAHRQQFLATADVDTGPAA